MSARRVIHLRCLKDAWQQPHEEQSLLRNGGLAPEELRIVHAFESDLDPSVLEGATHLTIGGSGWSVFDGAPRWPALMRTIREARERGLPILGICFGAQALAQAFGGNVIRSEANAEFGTVRVHVGAGATHDPLLGRLVRGTFTAQASHHDQIVALPEDASKLAWSFVRHNVQVTQAFRFGDEPVWGVQFHPERDDESMKAVMADPNCSYAASKRATIERTLAPSSEASRILYDFLRL